MWRSQQLWQRCWECAADLVKSVRVRVKGLVQGVGFRWFVQKRARDRHLAGWVKNLHSGGVEAAVSGEESDVDALCEDIRRGPSGSRIDSIAISAGADADGALPTPFEIVH